MNFITRLIKYRRILIQLRSLGLGRVFSNILGDAIGVSSALVRKDMAHIALQGNRRGGYSISQMLNLLNHLLGWKEKQELILVGCGNLGRALLKHEPFIDEGIRFVAAFDVETAASSFRDIPILPMRDMERFIHEKEIKVAILAVPASAAAEVRDQLLHAGIKGILNFAPVELKCDGLCVINNVNIGLEIENLFFLVNPRGNQGIV